MIIFCKTTNKDFLRLLILIESIEKYNKDNLKFYISKNNMNRNIIKTAKKYVEENKEPVQLQLL